MIQRRGHDGIAACRDCLAVEAVVWQQLPRFSLKRVIEIRRLRACVIELHEQALGPVKVVVEDEENDTLLCLARISCI